MIGAVGVGIRGLFLLISSALSSTFSKFCSDSEERETSQWEKLSCDQSKYLIFVSPRRCLVFDPTERAPSSSGDRDGILKFVEIDATNFRFRADADNCSTTNRFWYIWTPCNIDEPNVRTLLPGNSLTG